MLNLLSLWKFNLLKEILNQLEYLNRNTNIRYNPL